MKKKILILTSILLIIICIGKSNIIEGATHSGSVRQVIGETYSNLIKFSFGDFSEDAFLYDGDAGVLCVHDASFDERWCGHSDILYEGEWVKCNCQYKLSKSFSGNYYYYDKIYFNNTDGDAPTEICYIKDGDTVGACTDEYGMVSSFLSRFFYEGRELSWSLLHEYRFVCSHTLNTSDFWNWLSGKGSFNYFLNEKTLSSSDVTLGSKKHYLPTWDKENYSAINLYYKSLLYSNFICALENKFTINDENYKTINNAISNKESPDININNNWSIELEAPYYSESGAYPEADDYKKVDCYYNGVTFQYAFINSSSYTEETEVTFETATAVLKEGESGIGYKTVVVSGNANTDTSKDTLIIKCSYPTYSGLAMGFATGSGQERFLVSGKENTYTSYIAYDINATPKVSVEKTVWKVNNEAIKGRIGKTTNEKKSNPVETQLGDTVIFWITVTNESSSTVTFNLIDGFNNSVLIYDEEFNTDWGWIKGTATIAYRKVELAPNASRDFVIRFKVTDNLDYTNTGENGFYYNYAKVQDFRVNEREVENDASAQTEDKDYIKILGFDYEIEKTVTKTEAEYGEEFYYIITVRNTGATSIKNIRIEDIFPEEELEITKFQGAMIWIEDEGGYVHPSSIAAGTESSFWIRCKVTKKMVNEQPSELTVTNTAKITHVENRNTVNITEEKEASVDIKILGYNYGISKTVDKTTAEVGDSLQYTITIQNTGKTQIKNVQIKDIIPSGLTNITISETDWSRNSSTNIFTYSGTIDKNSSKVLTINCTVSKDLLKTTDVKLTNTAEIVKVNNRFDQDITDKLNDQVDTTVLGYNYEISKYIWKVYKSDGKTEAGRFKTQAEPGDIVQYRIAVENNSSTSLHNISIEDVLPDGMTYVKSTDDWTKTGNTYTYSSEISAGRTVNLYITAQVTAPVANASVEIINTATLTKVKNKNGIDLTTGMKDDVSIIVLGYNVNLNKYIDIDNRKELTNEAKNNSPVIVQKGNEVKYSIVLQNTGFTTLYNPQIIDNLPDGLQYKSNSNDWTKNGNTYTYKGNLEPNKTVTLDITCKVTKSNMYLFNIENTATYGTVKNRNDIDTSSVLVLGNNKEYIRLDELDISGTVWEDSDADGVLENGESKISGIEVKLHSYDKNGKGYEDKVVAVTSTDENGKYTFKDVQKGLIRQDNGNYENVEGQGYKKYYIQFVYNGVTYESTKYSDRNNINDDGSIKDAYKTDSNAAERIDLRESFNKSLETISYNMAIGSDGTTKDLSYTKNGTTSTLDLTSSTTISAFSFAHTGVGYDTMDRLLWLGGNYTSDMSSYKVKENTDYLAYINLGLIRRETIDLELQNGIESFTETINGQELEYVRGNIQEAYTSHLYDQDYRYKYTDYTDEAIRNMKTELSELNIEVKYRTVITNNSGTINTVVNEVTQYYNENFKPVYKEDGKTLNTQEMKIDTNNDGIFDNENKLFTFTVEYEHVDGENIKTTGTAEAKLTSTYADLQEKNTSGYKIIYITGIDDIVLKPGESIIIYTKYIVDKDSARNLKLDNKLDIISEINSYSTYTDTSKNMPAGAIDIDSNPGNLGETNAKGKTTTITDKTYYEDDTSNTGITFKYPTEDTKSPYERQLTGLVWEDLASETIDGQKTGNGILEDSEDKVKDIKVELYEIVKVANEYKEILTASEVRTKEDGTYTITGFKPGMYIIRFTYGDKKENIYYNGQDYKSTIYTINSENSENTNDNIKELSQETRYSDARDDEQRRLEVMNYSIEMYNKVAEILKGEQSSNKEKLIENTKTFADTPTFIARIENVENDVSKIKYFKTEGSSMWYKNNDESRIYVRSYSIDNIDFGLIERPINEIQLEKYISEITLTTSAGDLLIDAKYESYYDEELEYWTTRVDEINSVGLNNIQAINNTEDHQGFRYINVDEELLQGATITITYGFKVINNSEVDHISSNLYVKASTTAEVKNAMTGAIEYKEENKNQKYTDSSKYYGYYLGGIYYKGSKTDDVVATIKVDTILDYVDNSLVFNVIDNNGKWSTAIADELKDKFIKEEVYTDLYNQVGSSIGKYLVDQYEIQYQTDTKNNLAVTVDDNTINPTLSKQLYPKEYVERMTDKTEEEKQNLMTATVELKTSTYLSSENESDDMVYENIAEIIKFTTVTGRRTESTSTVGNAKIYKAGYTGDDESLKEPDTSIVEKVMLTPPTGLSYIQRFSKTIIYVLSGIVIIVLGILFIPKLVNKIKNRKFIK